jgi:hypothetical protein
LHRRQKAAGEFSPPSRSLTGPESESEEQALRAQKRCQARLILRFRIENRESLDLRGAEKTLIGGNEDQSITGGA